VYRDALVARETGARHGAISVSFETGSGPYLVKVTNYEAGLNIDYTLTISR
jgi:hypothetical protein